MSIELKKNLLSKIPVDVIINNIIPYTYIPQNKKLLRDIKSFFSDFCTIENSYSYDYNYDVLIYDLICFCNCSYIPSYNMHENFGQLLKRSFKLKQCNYSELNNHVFIVFHRNVVLNPLRKIRFLWGILKPGERSRFINKYLLEDFYNY